ncbi:MAG: hypothetical protein WB682_11665 [Candidatus Dormiibacterota bacterium]
MGEALRHGDEEAFQSLIQRYHCPMLRLAARRSHAFGVVVD